MENKLEAGDVAPDFRLPSTDGEQTLSQYSGNWVVLYFYPRDNTPGCTTQACDLRDNLAALDAVVLGVSPDGTDSHAGFRQEHGLNFPLLSDEDHSVAESYGAWGQKVVFGNEVTGLIRSTFIVDPSGRIAAAMYNVKPAGHAAMIAGRLQELRDGYAAAA